MIWYLILNLSFNTWSNTCGTEAPYFSASLACVTPVEISTTLSLPDLTKATIVRMPSREACEAARKVNSNAECWARVTE